MIPLALGLVVLAAVCVCYDRENRQIRDMAARLESENEHLAEVAANAAYELVRARDEVSCYRSWYAKEGAE